MKILVTGSAGFIGKHFLAHAKRRGHVSFSFDLGDEECLLIDALKEVDFIVHLAGVNRPKETKEFYQGNTGFTKRLVDLVKLSGRNIPILMSSSVQAELGNDYGKSKKMAEDLLFASGLPVYVFRLHHVFGRGCRPNYNSVVATFCFNIAKNLPIDIHDPTRIVTFQYVEDVVETFLDVLEGKADASSHYLEAHPTFDCSLGHLADLIYSYKEAVESPAHLPLVHSLFELDLFKTFCGYLTEGGHTYNYAADERGSFEELYKSKEHGQISDNIAYPGIKKGGHYHAHKEEAFLTVIGKCRIKQRHVKTGDEIIDEVDGKNPRPVQIHPYYVHEIANVGQEESHTLMWVSEIYDPQDEDTFKE